jgi:predicted SprT family Zn-dependent metalloprotease
MNLNEAQTLARTAMDAHGLNDWRFRWDSAKHRHGQTDFNTRTISLSSVSVHHRSMEEVQHTIGHEIAHALVGHRAGHGPVWKAKMRELGLRPERTTAYSDEARIAIAKSSRYVLHCADDDRVLASKDRKGKRWAEYVCKCHRKPIVWKDNR